MSEFLVAGLKVHGLDAVLRETRRVRAALSAVPVKTDRTDARGIAKFLRMGWSQRVHLKTVSARDPRLLLSARESLGRRIRDFDNSVRWLLRGFGLRGPVGARGRLSYFVRAIIEDNPVLVERISPVLAIRDGWPLENRRIADLCCAMHQRLYRGPSSGALLVSTTRGSVWRSC